MTWDQLYSPDEDLQHINLLIDLVLSRPPTSVSYETSLSHVKPVKTSRRLNMNQSTLHSLMTVKLYSPEIKDYNPDNAIEKWLVWLLIMVNFL